MFVGGALIDFFGKVRMISICPLLLILLIGGMSFFHDYWSNEFFVSGFIMGFYVLITFSTIAIFAAAMQLC